MCRKEKTARASSTEVNSLKYRAGPPIRKVEKRLSGTDFRIGKGKVVVIKAL